MNRYCFLIIAVMFLSSCSKKHSLDDAERKWNVEDYTIGEFKMIGPAGPPYTKYFVFKNNKQLDGNVYLMKDNRTFRFQSDKTLYLELNTITNSIAKYRPNKELLDVNTINNISFRKNEYFKLNYDDKFNADTIWLNLDTNVTKRLNLNQIEKFVNYWNQSTATIYNDKRTNSDYLFIVHQNDGKLIRYQTVAKIMCLEKGGWNYKHEEIGQWDEKHTRINQDVFDRWWNEK